MTTTDNMDILDINGSLYEAKNLTIKDLIPYQNEIIELFNSNLEKGLSLKQNLESMTNFQLFMYIFINTYQYFQSTNNFNSKKENALQALKNVKAHAKSGRQECIKTLTTDFDEFSGILY